MAERLIFIKMQENAFLGIILFSEGTFHFALCFYAVCRTQHLSCPLYLSHEISDGNTQLGLPLGLQLKKEGLNRNKDKKETKE